MKNCRVVCFSLIELVIVITILGALAMLLIPQLSTSQRGARMATSAVNQGQIAQNIMLYATQQQAYPEGMDTLLIASAPEADPTGLYQDQENSPQKYGLPLAGPDLYKALIITELNTDAMGVNTYIRSLSRSGFNYFFNHDKNVLNASESGVFKYTVPSGKSPGQKLFVAEVNPDTSNVTAGNLTTAVLGEKGIPPDAKLIVLGFGPRNSAVGRTTVKIPYYPGCDGTYYGPYVALFLVYKSGARANLVSVVDSYGRWSNYSVQQYQETLPGGARLD